MKKSLIIPAQGIGDALILTTLTPSLTNEGYHLTFIHPSCSSLASLFPNEKFLPLKKENLSDTFLKEFDLIVIQNDNSAFVKDLRQRGEVFGDHLFFLYPTYSEKKHGSKGSQDFIFNPKRTMVENVANFSSILTFNNLSSKRSSIVIPENYSYRKEDLRVLFFPLSNERFKNWPIEKFIDLAKKIKEIGLEPTFITEKKEDFAHAISKAGFKYLYGLSLIEVTQLIYESGYVIGNDSFPCHLASLFSIPHLVIADCKERMALWRPGWELGELITLHPFLSRFHLFKKRWKCFVGINQVLRSFESLFGSF